LIAHPPPGIASAMKEVIRETGRSCDGCTLCCKLIGVQEIEKPRGTWCVKCAVSIGCTIHKTRPQACRNFFCGYMLRPIIGDHWRPEISGMVIVWAPERNRIAINVDPDRPNVWREEPYYSDIAMWATIYPPDTMQIILYTGYHVQAFLLDGVIDLGILPEEDLIVTEMVHSPTGFRPKIYAMKPDDPRAAEFAG